jgi:hypothetical protein
MPSERERAVTLLSDYFVQGLVIVPYKSQATLVFSLVGRLMQPSVSSHVQLEEAWGELTLQLAASGHDRSFRHSLIARLSTDRNTWFEHLQPKSKVVAYRDFSRPLAERYSDRSVIQKVEKVLAVLGGELQPFTPRIVSAVGFDQQDVVGPIAYSVMLAFKELVALALESDEALHAMPFVPVFGLNQVEVGRLVTRAYDAGYTFARSDDFSHFDASISRRASEFEYAFYATLIPLTNEERQSFAHQVDCTLRSSLGVSYRKPEGRNSGDCNTSLGNTLLNGYAKIYALRHSKVPYILFVSGDDTLVLSKAALDITPTEYAAELAKLGFEVKTKDTGFHAATFLSARFARCIVDEISQFVLVPLVGKCLAKLFWSTSPLAVTTPNFVRDAIITAAKVAFSPDSVVSAYLSEFQTTGEELDVSTLSYFFRECLSSNFDIQPIDTNGEYVARYGPDIASQLFIGLHHGPALINPIQLPVGVIEKDAGL